MSGGLSHEQVRYPRNWEKRLTMASTYLPSRSRTFLYGWLRCVWISATSRWRSSGTLHSCWQRAPWMRYKRLERSDFHLDECISHWVFITLQQGLPKTRETANDWGSQEPIPIVPRVSHRTASKPHAHALHLKDTQREQNKKPLRVSSESRASVIILPGTVFLAVITMTNLICGVSESFCASVSHLES